jgi:hypothetical protein
MRGESPRIFIDPDYLGRPKRRCPVELVALVAGFGAVTLGVFCVLALRGTLVDAAAPEPWLRAPGLPPALRGAAYGRAAGRA